MEKAINTKTKKINVIYGFFGDNNYGVDYPYLVDKIELSMLLPYINKGEDDMRGDILWDIVYHACKDMEKPWSMDIQKKYNIYMEVRTLKYEPTIAVTFRIVENAAQNGINTTHDRWVPLNTNVTREQAVAEAGEKSIKELENYWGF